MADTTDVNLEKTESRRQRENLDSSDTVYVACKLPNGLEIFDEVEDVSQEQMFGGGFKEVKVWRKTGQTYQLNGNAIDWEQQRRSGEQAHLIIGGYGITPGIPREFWERWVERHKTDRLVTGGFVKAHRSESGIRGYAREHAKLQSGMEPINPDDPGERWPDMKKIQPGTTNDETAAA